MHTSIRFTLAAGALTLMSAAIAPSAAAISFADVQDETFFTRFNDTGSNAVASEPYAPNADENPIGEIADFGDVGRVAFIQNTSYYVANPNAWAFAGEGQADIVFDGAIESISLAVRGTAAGDQAGPNGLFPFQGINNGGDPDLSFAEADGIVYALDAEGNFIDGSGTEIQNISLQNPDDTGEVDEINFSAKELGQDIFGLAFVQRSTEENSGIFVGGLGATPESVPEPTALLGLAAAGGAGLLLRRQQSVG